MSKTSGGPPPIVFILLFLALAGGGWYFFIRKPSPQVGVSNTSQVLPPPTLPPPQMPGGAPPLPVTSSSVPAGTKVRIDGSTSMVTINQNLKNGFQAQFPGTTVVTSANGTEQGIRGLIAGSVDLAAISRPLTPQEQSQGLIAVPVAQDAIAIVVGVNNPFKGGLSSGQVEDIFEGDIVDWSQVGGQPGQIRVINRPPISGTHQAFRELVLGGGNFGTTSNIITIPQDATTPLLRSLGNDGIGYATYAQVARQQTVRVVPVNGVMPDNPIYPYKRILYYAYRNPPSPVVSSFLDYVRSPQGQQAIFAGG